MAKDKKEENKKPIDPNKADFKEEQYTEKIKEIAGEEKLSSQEAVKTAGELPYTIELYDIWGSTSKRAVRFGAKRFIEKGNVFLMNEKRGFKEPFPEDSEDFRSFKMEWVETEIKEINTKISKTMKAENPKWSLKDLRKDKKELENYRRSLELQGKGSYMLVDSDAAGGRPLFMFDRRGNYKLPVFKNIDLSLMYLPTEANITEASDLIRENNEKNGKSSLNLAQLGLFVLMVVIILAGLFFAYKTASLDLSFVDVLKDITTSLNAQNEMLGDYIETAKNITNPVLNESITPNLDIVNK